jgi:hypothetical protein
MSLSEWQDEVKSRENLKDIKFRCPVCGNGQSINDFIEAGVDKDKIEGVFYFSCIGRFTGAKSMSEKPCNYTSGGLLKMNSLFVIDEDGKDIGVFDFSDNPLCEEED